MHQSYTYNDAFNNANWECTPVFFLCFSHVHCACYSVKLCVQDPCQPLTHGSGKNNNPQHIHAFAGTRWCFHNNIRWRREIKGEVLDVGAIVILDAIDVDPTRGGLIQELSHRWFGDELRDSLGSILETKAEHRPKHQHSKHETNTDVESSRFSHDNVWARIRDVYIWIIQKDSY